METDSKFPMILAANIDASLVLVLHMTKKEVLYADIIK
jgi:hypothetical protein